MVDGYYKQIRPYANRPWPAVASCVSIRYLDKLHLPRPYKHTFFSSIYISTHVYILYLFVLDVACRVIVD